MRVLVTGGAGFIGSAVCRHLVADLGIAVVNVDALTYAANPASLDPIAGDPLYAFEHADIRDAGALAAIFARWRPSAVVHLAAESHVDRSIDGARIFMESNVLGTMTLLEAARTYLGGAPAEIATGFRFVHVSTDEVFGSAGPQGAFTAHSSYDPSSPYAASKAASDHLVRAWGRTYGLPVIVANASNNYGPCQFPEKLIPLSILNALEGRPLLVYGDGLNVRDWLHVEDHARGLALVLQRGQVCETYLFGGGAERTTLQVVEAICRALDARRPQGAPHARLITFVADRPGHDRRNAVDFSKAEAELGWRPLTTFEQGLAGAVDWYLSNEDWWRPLRERVYGGARLGLL